MKPVPKTKMDDLRFKLGVLGGSLKDIVGMGQIEMEHLLRAKELDIYPPRVGLEFYLAFGGSGLICAALGALINNVNPLLAGAVWSALFTPSCVALYGLEHWDRFDMARKSYEETVTKLRDLVMSYLPERAGCFF